MKTKVRTTKFTIRITEEENSQLQKAAEAHGFKHRSDLTRHAIYAFLSEDIALQFRPEELAESIRTLRGIATNLNQLTRKVNSGSLRVFPNHVREITETLQATRALYKTLIAAQNRVSENRISLYEEVKERVAEGR